MRRNFLASTDVLLHFAGDGLCHAPDRGAPGRRQAAHHRVSRKQNEPNVVQNSYSISSETHCHSAASGRIKIKFQFNSKKASWSVILSSKFFLQELRHLWSLKDWRIHHHILSVCYISTRFSPDIIKKWNVAVFLPVGWGNYQVLYSFLSAPNIKYHGKNKKPLSWKTFVLRMSKIRLNNSCSCEKLITL